MAEYAYSEGSATSETRHAQTGTRKPQKKLSGTRLARKREIDRQAQRSARVKTKNLIAHLESRIEELTRVHTSGDVKDLIDQLEDQRKQNEELKTTLQAIGKLVGSKFSGSEISLNNKEDNKAHHSPYSDQDSEQGDAETTDLVNVSPKQELTTTASYDGGASYQTMYDVFADLCSAMPATQVLDAQQMFLGDNEIPQPRTPIITMNQSFFQGTSILGQPRLPIQKKECNCCDSVRFTTTVLEGCSRMQIRETSALRARDTDICVRAVLHGWEVVSQKYLLDPVWTVLRHVDQAVFSNCGKSDRIAILRLMILMLRYRANRSEQNLEALPFFLRELPAQRLIPHTPLVDFLVWPALRERFVLYPHNFCSEKFFSLFWNNFRFLWGYTLQDAYTVDYSTGLYQFSTIFAEQTFDLQHWRMTNEFLEEFPQLKEDMPAVIPISEVVECVASEDPFGFEKIAGEFGTHRQSNFGLETSSIPNGFYDHTAQFQADQNIRVGSNM